jgi:predicted nucleic acid-binding Zn ribbon protein
VGARELQSVKDLLPSVLAQVAKDSGRAKQLKPIWDEVVGPSIARSAVPFTLEGTHLVVSCATARWQHELSRRESELRERLEKKLGKGTVTRVVFRLAG